MGNSKAEGTGLIPEARGLVQSAKRSIRKKKYRQAWNEVEKALQVDKGNEEAKALRLQLEKRQRHIRNFRLLLILPFALRMEGAIAWGMSLSHTLAKLTS